MKALQIKKLLTQPKEETFQPDYTYSHPLLLEDQSTLILLICQTAKITFNTFQTIFLLDYLD